MRGEKAGDFTNEALMKHQASQLCGYALTWAVAQVYGLETQLRYESFTSKKPFIYAVQAKVADAGPDFVDWYAHSSHEFHRSIWSQNISVNYQPETNVWKASCLFTDHEVTGQQMFEAIARLIVLNKYPEGLEVPEALHPYCV